MTDIKTKRLLVIDPEDLRKPWFQEMTDLQRVTWLQLAAAQARCGIKRVRVPLGNPNEKLLGKWLKDAGVDNLDAIREKTTCAAWDFKHSKSADLVTITVFEVGIITVDADAHEIEGYYCIVGPDANGNPMRFDAPVIEELAN